MEMPHLYRPTPRRPFELAPASTDNSRPSTPPADVLRQNPDAGITSALETPSSPPTRDTSILNLTSATLTGIYSRARREGSIDESATPWRTGAQTPTERDRINWAEQSVPTRVTFDPHPIRPRALSTKRYRSGFKNYYLPLLWQTLSLFAFGIAFGLVVTQLQRTRRIAPLPVPTFVTTSWQYQFLWGLAGVVVGNALPRVDALMSSDEAIVDGEADIQAIKKTTRARSSASGISDVPPDFLSERGLGPIWLSAVRSIGAFVGIAFAVRQVPWQSTLQLSLTLATANPVLWFLIDRSVSGFALSAIVGVAGSFLLLLSSPDFVPIPAIHQGQASEKFGVYTWLASILFCTSLCFGAIGRKFQL